MGLAALMPRRRRSDRTLFPVTEGRSRFGTAFSVHGSTSCAKVFSMAPLDYKKEDKLLYQPPADPMVLDVPEMQFFMVDGSGDPNTPGGAYEQAVELLYALSYAVRMGGKKGAFPAPDYVEYVVLPLEGLWWNSESNPPEDKNAFRWTSMIRQPGFITEEAFDYARASTMKKKPHLNAAAARMASFTEGLCVQCLHTGSYDEEPATVARMHAFMEQSGLRPDMGNGRTHHEIYLSDPRKTPPERLKTILRIPVKA